MTFQPTLEAVPATEDDDVPGIMPSLGVLFGSGIVDTLAFPTLKLVEVFQRVAETGLSEEDIEVHDGISAEALDLYVRRRQSLESEDAALSGAGAAPRKMLDGLVDPGSAPEGAEYWGGSGAPIVWDIAKGVLYEGPKQAFAGVSDGIGNTLLAVDELAGWLNRNVADLRFSTLLGNPDTSNPEMNSPEFKEFAEGFKAIERGDTVSGSLIRDTAAFLTGLALAKQAPGFKYFGKLRTIVAGVVSAFLTTDPDAPGLSNLIQQYPFLATPITAFLATKPGDNAALNRFKHAVEELGLGFLAEGLGLALSAIRNARAVKAASESGLPLLEADERKLLTHRVDEDSGNTEPGQVAGARLDETDAANNNTRPRPFIGLLDVIRNSIDDSLARMEAMTDAELTELWAGKVAKNAPRGGRLPDSIIGYDVDFAVKLWFNEYLPHWNTRFKERGRVSGRRQEPDFAEIGFIDLKPGTPSGIQAGIKQAERYRRELQMDATYMTYELAPDQMLRLQRIKEHIRYLHLRKYRGDPLPMVMPIQRDRVPIEIRLPNSD